MPDSDTKASLAENAPEKAEGLAQWRRRLLVPFASLQNHDFRWLWYGQLGHASAMWAEHVARNWLTWQLTGSGTALGLVNLFRAIPLITLGLVGGVVADRFDKRKVLIAIQLWSLSIFIAMAVLVLGGWIRLWHIYLTSFLMGCALAMNQPIRTSWIPQLLERRLLVNGFSLNSIAVNVTRLTGPAAIGFLIAFAGGNVGPAYVVSSALYGLVVLSTLMIRASHKSSKIQRASIGGELVEGFRYMLVENRMVLALVVMAVGPLAFGFSYITLLPVFVTEVLHMGSTAYGTMQSVTAIGGLAGGLALASAGNVPHKGKIMLVAGLGFGIAVAALSQVHMLALAFAVLILIGAAQSAYRATNQSALSEITPPRLQGRVMSMTFLDTGVQSLASVLAGAVTDVWGLSAGLMVIGSICVVIVAISALAAPGVRRL